MATDKTEEKQFPGDGITVNSGYWCPYASVRISRRSVCPHMMVPLPGTGGEGFTSKLPLYEGRVSSTVVKRRDFKLY